jgi:hypothetical protein
LDLSRTQTLFGLEPQSDWRRVLADGNQRCKAAMFAEHGALPGAASAGGGPFPLWPLDPEGDFVTFDEVLDEWERFLKA